MLKLPFYPRRLAGRILYFFAAALLTGVLLFAGLYFYVPFSLEQITGLDASPALYDKKGRLFHVRLSGDSEWILPIPLSEMGRWLPVIAVNVEDGRFYSHPGIDVLAILRAGVQNVFAGKVISGASTITSQVIRLAVSEREFNSELDRIARRQRNLTTKVMEFIQALKLERVMTKDKILEFYLNRAPFGGNIRGVQAAAYIYFGKPASKLSPGEASLMIGMLKGPTLYRPDTRPIEARKRRDSVIKFLEERGVFSKSEAERAMLEELPRYKYAPPMRAFHFAEMLLGDRPQSAQNVPIKTTLDIEIQTKLETLLRQVLSELPQNITLAVGIVENKTSSLVAWVGNARFGRGQPGSWVDCGRALRSPGSTLKPFAYLSAFDQGLLTPSSLLGDSPLAFSGRAPRNFDLTYRGAVSVRVALSDSLNAPAVRVLRLAEPDRVLELMRAFGLRSLKESSAYYGDSLILGGCDVTLLQVLEAYTALANEGIYRSLALTQKDSDYNFTAGNRLVSPAACWFVCDILDNRGRLSALMRESLGQGWHVAFKTGTSYGLRDAWTAAWTPDYTVVVWAGNPDGTPWNELIGVKIAAPVALRILRNVSPASSWYSRPEGLALRKVCSLSGQPPTAACLATRMDWSIEGITQTLPCTIHVLKDGKKALAWPSELATRNTPQLQLKKRPSLTITAPVAGATYLLAPLALEQKIPMRVEGAAEVIWWYLDGKYIGSSLPNETFFYSLSDGEHVLAVMDKEGRTASVNVKVVSPGRKKEQPPELL